MNKVQLRLLSKIKPYGINVRRFFFLTTCCIVAFSLIICCVSVTAEEACCVARMLLTEHPQQKPFWLKNEPLPRLKHSSDFRSIPVYSNHNTGCGFLSCGARERERERHVMCSMATKICVMCFRSMWQADEDHWAADGENVGDQIWSLDDRPTGVSQKQPGEPTYCAFSLCCNALKLRWGGFNNLHTTASLLLFSWWKMLLCYSNTLPKDFSFI